MTVKLLNSKEDPETHADDPSVLIDQVALVLPLGGPLADALGSLERSPQLDLAVAYESHATRDGAGAALESERNAHLRRLGFARGRPGIGWPSAVHLERCAAPARTVVSNSPCIAALGGIGMLALTVSDAQLCEVIASGRLRWQTPQVLQVMLSGRLSPCVSARDVALELLRRGIAEKVENLTKTHAAPVALEFSGPGLHSLTVTDRALLCSMAEDVNASCAISVSDDKTEMYLRDQRRSKAFRQLTSDAGAPCADAICLDLSTVVPLVALDSGVISKAAELGQLAVREVIIGADHSVGLRDLLTAAAWFKTKRIN
ncbi:MAG TPA: aconitase family protein, partial [Polyangiaceae bacterium]